MKGYIVSARLINNRLKIVVNAYHRRVFDDYDDAKADFEKECFQAGGSFGITTLLPFDKNELENRLVRIDMYESCWPDEESFYLGDEPEHSELFDAFEYDYEDHLADLRSGRFRGAS